MGPGRAPSPDAGHGLLMASFDTLRLADFEAAPGAKLHMTCHAARFPDRRHRMMLQQFAADTGRRSESKSLPGRALADLLAALDPNVLHVSGRLNDGVWIFSRAPVDGQVLVAAVEAWAATEITDDRPWFDWLEILTAQAVEWDEVAVDLLAGEICSSGTVRPSTDAFALLPSYLAGLV